MLLPCKYEEVAVPMVEDLVLFFGFGPFALDVFVVSLFFSLPPLFFFFSHPALTLFLSLFLFFLLLPSPAVHPLTGYLRRFPSHSFSPPSHDQTDSASSNFPFSLSLCQPPLGPRIEFQIFEGFGTHRRTGKPLLLFISISALPSL
jgi:hypothetical protein